MRRTKRIQLKIQIVSDLHLDFEPIPQFEVKADVLVVAGDLDVSPLGAWHFFYTQVPSELPCIYVLGNHEHADYDFPAVDAYRERLAELPNVHVLERDCVTIGGVTFAGATLWTNVPPAQADNVATIMQVTGLRATPERITMVHQETVAWLRGAVQPRSRTVVVTHMAPSRKSEPPEHRNTPLASFFWTDLDSLIEELPPPLWVHGHIHAVQDYTIGRTRVVANARGYRPSLRTTGFTSHACLTLARGSIKRVGAIGDSRNAETSRMP